MKILFTSILLAWVELCAGYYGVPPRLPRAVAIIESGTEIETIRIGLIGEKQEVYGPMGVARCFTKRWPLEDPFCSAWAGVRGLAIQTRKCDGDIVAALHKYNPEDHNGDYAREVMRLWRQIKRERTLAQVSAKPF